MKIDIFEKIKNLSARTKKLIALAVCLVLLAVAVIQNAGVDESKAGNINGDSNINVSINAEENIDSDVITENNPEGVGEGVIKVEDVDEYFAAIRLNKLNDRSEIEETCNSIIENDSAQESSVAEAVSKMELLKSITKTENSLETSIKSRGYNDVFVIIENDSVFITVNSMSMNANEASAIAVSACDITGFDIDDIILKGVY